MFSPKVSQPPKPFLLDPPQLTRWFGFHHHRRRLFFLRLFFKWCIFFSLKSSYSLIVWRLLQRSLIVFVQGYDVLHGGQTAIGSNPCSRFHDWLSFSGCGCPARSVEFIWSLSMVFCVPLQYPCDMVTVVTHGSDFEFPCVMVLVVLVDLCR